MRGRIVNEQVVNSNLRLSTRHRTFEPSRADNPALRRPRNRERLLDDRLDHIRKATQVRHSFPILAGVDVAEPQCRRPKSCALPYDAELTRQCDR